MNRLICGVAFALAIFSAGLPALSQEVADRVFIGGSILTMDDQDLTAEALA